MATLVTRSGKGSPLTHAEVDANFTNLNTDKLELSGGTMTGNLSFGDNDKAIFGAGSDLQIYHDGSDSYVQESGAGNLYLSGQNHIFLTNSDQTQTYAAFNAPTGWAKLYYSNAEKLATTSTGVDITGTLTTDQLTVYNGTSDPDVLFRNNGTGDVTLTFRRGAADDVYTDWSLVNDSGTFKFISDNSSDPDHTQLTMSQGDISFYEDTGTTAKFFWDASAERLGLGNTTPSTILHLTDTHPSILFETSGGGATDQAYIQKYSNDLYIYNKESAGKLFLGTNNGTKATIDSSGQVGIGTSSPNKLMHLKANSPVINLHSDNASFAQISFTNSGGVSEQGFIKYEHAGDYAGSMQFRTSGSERMRIDSSGRLLLGTTTAGVGGADELTIAGSGATGITIRSGTTSTSNLYFADGTSGNAYYRGFVVYSHSTDHLALGSAGVERMRIDSSGNVGIGTSSPSAALEVNGGTDNEPIKVVSTDAGSYVRFEDDSTTGSTRLGAVGNDFKIDVNSSEAMRIDSSGNLLVGRTSTAFSGTGHIVQSNGIVYHMVDGAAVQYLRRNTSDGDIVRFYKDTTEVGSIGTYTSLPYIGKSDVTLLFDPSGPHIIPRGTNGGARDAAINLGASTNRFKDVWASGSLVGDNAYLSGGVYLGGTGSANKLDDYEEGTWTPYINTLSQATYSLRDGRYTKIGNMVYCDGAIALTSKGTLTGGVTINGLPFTVESYNVGTSLETGATSIAWWDGTTGISALSITPNSAGTNAIIRAKATGNATLDQALQTSQITDAFSVRFNFVYRTT